MLLEQTAKIGIFRVLKWLLILLYSNPNLRERRLDLERLLRRLSRLLDRLRLLDL